MADTRRTLAAILALLADNTAGDISPQDLRDFVISAMGEYASIYVSGGVTAQTVSGTPAKMTGFAANGISAGATPDHTNDQITIGTAGDYQIDFQLGSFTGTNGSTVTLNIYVNGATSSIPPIVRALSNPAAAGSGVTGGQLTLAASDVVTVYVSSTSTSYTPASAVLKVARLS
jgi:hypothetical protein